MSNRFDIAEQYKHNHADLVLRSPLPLTSASTANSLQSTIRPILCRMFVAAQVLTLHSETTFTALVLLHRFAAARLPITPTSLKSAATTSREVNYESVTIANEIEWPWVAAACLLLACKSEEEPRRLRDIVNLVHMVLLTDEEEVDNNPTPVSRDELSQALSRPPSPAHVRQVPPPLNEQYWESKDKLVKTEQVVLRWLGFDASVSKPHRAVLLLLEEGTEFGSLCSVEHRRISIVSKAWKRLNDALFFSPALQHTALALASASIVLSLEELGNDQDQEYPVENGSLIQDGTCGIIFPGGSWWTRHGIFDEDLSAAKQSLILASESLVG